MKGDMNHSVEIAKGLGSIKFGFSTKDVEGCLGVPDETEIVDPETDVSELWLYKSLKLQILFLRSSFYSAEVADDLKHVVQLSSRNPATTLWGERIIGRPQSEVLTLFKARGYEAFVERNETLPTSGYKALRLESIR